MKTFSAGVNDAGIRMDNFTAKVCPGLPKSLLYKYIRIKRIKVNGKKTELSYRLAVGDVVDMYINDEFFDVTEENAFLSSKVSVEVVYEDDNILVVNKPQGLVVHEDDNGEKINTLISGIKKYLYDKGDFDPSRENTFAPALCNRIDRNTGGLVIAAKTAEALKVMNQKIKDREIEKYYYCLVRGVPHPKEGTLKNWLLKDENKKEVRVYDKPGPGRKTAVTEYSVVKEYEGSAFVRVKLITGRTHQVRAQFAHAGNPLLGDGKYGDPKANARSGMKYQALFSYKIVFKFSTDAAGLEYLNGTKIEVPKERILKNWGII
ncbi:MAG: RluA family pseudouridine synthase [Clostridia bacterium]|nr:RluA family pseudouridine synthase [Clostridia bacterium]